MHLQASAQSRSATPVVALVSRLIALVGLLAPAAAFAAFGYSDNGTAYVVDTGAGLVFQVNKTDGTITSIVYNGVEYSGPSGKGSHLSSGLGSATVTPETDGTTYIKLTLQTGTTGTADPNMTQYLVVRNGENKIYMATFPGQEPNVGELRWITRLDHSKLLNGPEPSNLLDTNGNIESTDVFGKPDGTTRSKYYGDHVTHGKERAMDLTYDGATGDNVGVWMIFGNRESSSGGPFFRDIQNQGGSDQEIYNYMNSGHNQTEPYRLNVLHGPYALVFNNGAAPTYPIDFSWMGSLNLMGWVPASGRGAVSGTASGIPAGFQGVVGFANATAQYWAVINPSDGSYTCSGMKPGDYAATLYKGELEVATASVTVTAGTTASLNLASSESTPSVIFRIGEWDGTPAGLLNADHIPQMHPSDVRNGAWGPITYAVGIDDPSRFPAIQTRLANDGNLIQFTLAPNQVTDLTLRIGITCSYPKGGGRPVITVNNGATTAAPAASTQPDSRSFTIGTYRGNNVLYTYTIPAAQLVAGTNTIRINAVSGSTDSGTWLSAGWVYDAIELDGPIAAPTITYVGSNPVVISGTAEPNRNIAVTLDGTIAAGSTVASASGAWSITYSMALGAGPHTATAIASDSTGHSSPASAPFTFNTAITMPLITQALGDTGTYANGANTSDRVFTFNGTAAASDTVTVTRVGVGPIGSVIADGAGNWTFDYSSVSLPDGQNSFFATSSNVGGNSASSPVFTLNLQGAPRVAITRLNPNAQVITAGFGTVVFRVTFNAPVSGVSASSFAVATTNTAAGSVTSVSASNGTVFDLSVGNLAGVGELHLNLAPNNGIVDGNGNQENPYTAGEFYQLVAPSTGNGTWTQSASGGRWSDPRNWQNAVVADGASSTANFSTLDLLASNTVHLDSARTLGSATFGDADTTSAASWTIDSNGSTSNTLTLAGASPSLIVNALGSGATVTIAAPLAGSGGLTKVGAGTLVLAAANSLSGPLNVTTGTVVIGPGAAQTVTTANMASPNGTLNIAGGTFTATGAATANGGGGTLVINSGVGNFAAVATNNSSNGLIRVNGGVFNAASITVPRSSDATPSFAFGFVVAGGNSVVSGPIGLGTTNSWGSMSVEGGSLTVGGPITVGNQATGGRGGQMRVTGNATFTSTDTASGIVLSRKNGTNANNVANATFSGGVSTVEKFTLGFDSTVNAGSANLTVNGGTLYLGSGGIVQNGVSPFVANVSLSSGTIGAKASWSTAVPITLPNGGNIAIKAADAANNPFAITLTGAVGGAGGFTKTGGGTLTLDGGVTHSFAGAAVVNAGTLRVTSTLSAATNGVTVNSGGTLAGNGTINRPITLNSGGIVAPDGVAPIATLTGASLAWNGGGTIAADLGAAGNSDLLALSGAFNQGTAGSYTFAFTPGAGFAAGNTYTLVTFGSTTFTDASAFSATGLPAGAGALFQLRDTSLQVRIQARPNLTSGTSATGMFAAPFMYTATADDTPATFSATNVPAGLTLDSASGTLSGTPTAAGTFVVPITVTNTAGSTTTAVTVTIAPAPAAVVLSGLSVTYDGNAHSAVVATTPAGLPVVVTYNGGASLPVNAGSYGVVATVIDPNFVGGATGTLAIAKATPTVTVAPYTVTYDGSTHTATGTSTGAKGETLSGLNVSATAHTDAGTYSDSWTFTDTTGNYVNLSSSVTDVINQATADIALSPLTQSYDGTPRLVNATTTPSGLSVSVTYNGTTTAPTWPGAYNVSATVNDTNYTGTTTDTLHVGTTVLVRHAPVVNGDIDGSAQVLLGESITLNGGAGISGDLLVPGTPTLRLNGNPTIAGTQDGGGATTPSGYSVTLNGRALLRYLVQRVDPITLPAAPTPVAGAGTRDVVLNSPNDSVGDFSTVRDLTVNGGVGTLELPPGAYRNVIVNGNTALVLGTAGSGTVEYDFQSLTLNGSAPLRVVGPVTLILANGTSVSATAGAADHPEWLSLSVANGGVTLNGTAIVYGTLLAPNGMVIVNGGSAVHGTVSSDRLTINGNGVIVQP